MGNEPTYIFNLLFYTIDLAFFGVERGINRN